MAGRVGRGLAAAVFCAALLAGGGASAEEPAKAPRPEAASLPVAEAEDYEIYQRAMDDMSAKGFRGLNRHLTDLRTALDRAPASYPLTETQGKRTIIRSNDQSEGLMLGVLAMTTGGSSDIAIMPNVYPMIAFTLGSHAVEYGRFDEAIGYLDRGLKLQPYNWLLVTEKAAALQGLKRWEDSLAVVDEAMASGDPVLMRNASTLHRKRGFALIELGRLDEAEAAYEQSLKDEPGNPNALRELDYIHSLRAGGPKAGMELTAPASQP